MMERILSEIKFTCMGTYMSLQQPRTGETFSTKWTLASLVMSSNVHRIGGHRDVSFLTMRTFPRLLVLQRPVKQSTNQRNALFCVCGRRPTGGKKVQMFVCVLAMIKDQIGIQVSLSLKQHCFLSMVPKHTYCQ